MQLSALRRHGRDNPESAVGSIRYLCTYLVVLFLMNEGAGAGLPLRQTVEQGKVKRPQVTKSQCRDLAVVLLCRCLRHMCIMCVQWLLVRADGGSAFSDRTAWRNQRHTYLLRKRMMRLFPSPPGGFESCLPSGVTVRHRTCDDSTRDKMKATVAAKGALMRTPPFFGFAFEIHTITMKGSKKIRS